MPRSSIQTSGISSASIGRSSSGRLRSISSQIPAMMNTDNGTKRSLATSVQVDYRLDFTSIQEFDHIIDAALSQAYISVISELSSKSRAVSSEKCHPTNHLHNRELVVSHVCSRVTRQSRVPRDSTQVHESFQILGVVALVLMPSSNKIVEVIYHAINAVSDTTHFIFSHYCSTPRY